jgi:hypothetical protein
MEKYLTSTEGLLALIQATLSQEQLDRSTKAGEEMWEAIRAVTDKYKLNVQEMLNATLACHATIIEVANDQINEVREGMKI